MALGCDVCVGGGRVELCAWEARGVCTQATGLVGAAATALLGMQSLQTPKTQGEHVRASPACQASIRHERGLSGGRAGAAAQPHLLEMRQESDVSMTASSSWAIHTGITLLMYAPLGYASWCRVVSAEGRRKQVD